jgi:glutathione S-transferase
MISLHVFNADYIFADTGSCHLLARDNLVQIKMIEASKYDSFLQLNPQHNIPTLVDGEFVTNESRAAAAYLVNKYGGDKKNELYPECPEARAKVDQRMYFDMGTFYKAFGECVVSINLNSLN